MSVDSYTLFAASYANVQDARDDFDAVKDLYEGLDLSGTFDAAVIAKENGKVKIVRKREEAEHHDGWIGAGIGLAVGCVCALFPAVGIWSGLLAGGVAGGAIGVITGHVVAGVSRKDLKEIGEDLDESECALIVVAAEDVQADVNKAISRADKVTSKELKADSKEIEKELKEIDKQA